MSALPTSLPSSARPLAVIWDYDGTLVATRFADEAAVAELVRSDPSAAAGAEVFWATEGQPIIQRLELAWPGRSAEVLPLFDQRVRPHLHRGVTRVLADLRQRGVPMAVVSSRRCEPLEWGLHGPRPQTRPRRSAQGSAWSRRDPVACGLRRRQRGRRRSRTPRRDDRVACRLGGAAPAGRAASAVPAAAPE